MKKLLISALLIQSVFPASYLTSYADNLPDLGDSAQTVLSRQQEQALGDQIMSQIRMASDVIDDVEVRDYLNRLGNRLVAASHDPRQRFEFFVVDDPTLNAFAMPGGYIGVHTGLILTAQSESELAAVLSHEIAHVTQRHLSRSLEKNKSVMLAGLAVLAAGLLASRSSSGQATEAAIVGSQALVAQGQLNFTREHEYEADRIGIQTLAAAGFDPHAMTTFFGRMEKGSRLYNSNAPEYLRTHPLDSARIAESQNRTNNAPYKQVVDSAEYNIVREKLRAMDGSAAEKIRFFESAIREKRVNLEAASYYGLAFAYLRDNQFDKAHQAVDSARKTLKSPLLESLDAKILLAANKPAEAVKVYKAALAQTPNHYGLSYGYIQLLLAQHQTQDAIKQIQQQIKQREDNAAFYALLAEAYSQQGKTTEQQQAQAEFYYRQGQVEEAIVQLQMAVRNKQNDFYLQSTLEARLKSLQAERDLVDKKGNQ
ncbi:M48 family metalloprotease [Leeia sp. TBRC 13508]|uniref:M48 family metalloprotease n=1 Tax=Leeia speluncae TaxID=2884804 RepID=A0ABS8D5R8_9NEIS|nr:M48 family metalloprotease [Leeia speluncae]MCB6183512.1 M48 family metalloprotease [Leeia speluncae]